MRKALDKEMEIARKMVEIDEEEHVMLNKMVLVQLLVAKGDPDSAYAAMRAARDISDWQRPLELSESIDT